MSCQTLPVGVCTGAVAPGASMCATHLAMLSPGTRDALSRRPPTSEPMAMVAWMPKLATARREIAVLERPDMLPSIDAHLRAHPVTP